VCSVVAKTVASLKLTLLIAKGKPEKLARLEADSLSIGTHKPEVERTRTQASNPLQSDFKAGQSILQLAFQIGLLSHIVWTRFRMTVIQ
jgi:hypothetical protein